MPERHQLLRRIDAYGGDELARRGEGLVGRPRQPVGEPLAIGVDQRIDRLGVALGDWPQMESAIDVEPGHDAHSGAIRISGLFAFWLKIGPIRAEKSHVAHEPADTRHRAPAAAEATPGSYDAFVVIGLVAVIVGAATGSLAVALAIFAAPALALGAAIFVRSHF